VKLFFVVFALIAVFLASYPFFDSYKKNEHLAGLPWQINILNDHSTEVFGLNIGASRLADAIEKLGSDMELAIIAATNKAEAGNLEMYYGHYRSGLLSGKLVLQTDINEQTINRWRDNAPRSEYMASGLAKKYTLSPDDLVEILDQVIVGVTFIPTVNLDETEVVLPRFGEPEQRIQLSGVTHFLYPDKGLDLALHEDSKEVLQYVHPAAFSQLVAPLIAAAKSTSEIAQPKLAQPE